MISKNFKNIYNISHSKHFKYLKIHIRLYFNYTKYNIIFFQLEENLKIV
jgi:hypothetical protein